MFSVVVVVVLRELIARPLLNLADLLLVLIGVPADFARRRLRPEQLTAWLKSVQQMKSRPPTPPWVAEPVMRFMPEDSDYCRGLGKDVRGASHTRGRHDAHASK